MCNQLIRGILSRAFIVALAAPGATARADVSDYSYVTNDLGITITGYNCIPGNEVAIIPDTINGLPVTSIGDGAFWGCSSLTSVTIPGGVTSIESFAFYSCSALSGIVIPHGVTSVGDGAFRNCSSLTSVFIPDSVTNIGGEAFSYCGLTSVAIGNNVTTIGDYAFYSCSALTSVAIPDSVTSIGDYAFSYCALASVAIPDSVSNIGSYALASCSSLTSVYFAGDAPAVGSGVFLESAPMIYHPGGTTGWGTTFSGRPTALYTWPEFIGVVVPSSTGSPLALVLSGSANMDVLVAACTNLVDPVWTDVGTVTLELGTNTLTDIDWANDSQRAYRALPYHGP